MSYRPIEPAELQGNVFDLIGEKWMLITAKKYKSDQKVNTMTASWGGMGIMWGKPVAWCVVRPVRYTYGFMEEADCFTLSVLPEEYRTAMRLLGTKSGRNGDKITEAGLNLTDVEGFGGKAVSFTEADIILTCMKLYHQDVDPANFTDGTLDKSNYPKKDYHRMYFGEIAGCLVRE
jgi:flavin reductase (DIM6/NTAB) family NADH-FMN oxidoreductase RutF